MYAVIPQTDDIINNATIPQIIIPFDFSFSSPLLKIKRASPQKKKRRANVKTIGTSKLISSPILPTKSDTLPKGSAANARTGVIATTAAKNVFFILLINFQ